GPVLTTNHQPLLVVVLLRQPLQLLEEHKRPVRWNLKSLPARLTGDVVVHADEMVFDLLEHRAVAGVGTARNLRLPRAPHPADAVVVGAAAPRALKARRPLLGLLREELTLVHGPILLARVGVR